MTSLEGQFLEVPFTFLLTSRGMPYKKKMFFSVLLRGKLFIASIAGLWH
jgi:hypothetical protein